jgi:GTPase SAR1 family protein
MMNRPYDEMVKFLLVGDSSVGKSSLMRMFCTGRFNERETSTVGLEYG